MGCSHKGWDIVPQVQKHKKVHPPNGLFLKVLTHSHISPPKKETCTVTIIHTMCISIHDSM